MMMAIQTAHKKMALAGVCCLLAFLLVTMAPSAWAEETGTGQGGEEEPVAGFDQLLKEAMDSFLAEVGKIMADDSLTEEEKQAAVIELARKTRMASDTNAPENQDIFFQIFLPDGTLLVDPAKPDDEGKNFFEYRDQDDFMVFKEMLNVMAGGYLDYLWPRPDGEAQVAKKSYIQVLEPWGWVICVGKYLQTVEPYEPEVEPADFAFDDPPEEVPPASGD